MGKNRESGPSATWSYEIIIMFCDLCLREIALGNRPNTHFNKTGWTNLVENFKQFTGRDYDRLQLKNKWDLLKKEWKLWKDLKKDLDGFGWNPKRKTIDASDEWWKTKLEEFPSAKKFRYNGIDPEMEEKLDKMFMTAELPWPRNSDSLPPVVTDEDHEDFDECESTKSLPEDVKLVNEIRQSYSGSKRASQPSSNGKATRSKMACPKSGMAGAASAGVSQMFQDQMLKAQTLQKQIQQLVDAATLRSKATAALNKSFTITEAVRVLDSIEELEEDDELYGFSIDLLMQRESRELFLALKTDKKVWYLRREFEKSKKSFC
ncbi:L10-interacting MYB domain-containing protein-like [Phalaenopsis equestris]|uniref:L10-interacting MYB domain-containing protein-like n=1 Tax=Phalaenopsis equestris TaxID=78828 RepID=UPI0009E39B79|nr:L10-interacting MYB domain-containing protein-like [Phalaenopsis equestris]